MKMVPVEQGMEITGHTCKASFSGWVTRYNTRNPKHLILRRWGRVDLDTLKVAMQRESRGGAWKRQTADDEIPTRELVQSNG